MSPVIAKQISLLSNSSIGKVPNFANLPKAANALNYTMNPANDAMFATKMFATKWAINPLLLGLTVGIFVGDIAYKALNPQKSLMDNYEAAKSDKAGTGLVCDKLGRCNGFYRGKYINQSFLPSTQSIDLLPIGKTDKTTVAINTNTTTGSNAEQCRSTDQKSGDSKEKVRLNLVASQIYMGNWSDSLYDLQELPVGGKSKFSDKLDFSLRLDFSKFDDRLKDFTQDSIDKLYESKKANLTQWLHEVGAEVSPRTFFIAYVVQNKVNELLGITQGSRSNEEERTKMYQNANTPNLSQFKGKSFCAERAALGQYLLQRLGVSSSYVGATKIKNAKDPDAFPEAHSFIVLHGDQMRNSTLIYDIANPIYSEGNALPNLFRSKTPFTYDLLKDKRNFFVEAKNLISNQTMWFGVSKVCASANRICLAYDTANKN